MAFGQEGYFQLRGRIINKEKQKIGRVKYKLYKDKQILDSALTSQSGAFAIKFKLNSSYLIEFSKKDFTSKKIIVDTDVPQTNSSNYYDRFNIIKLDSIGSGDTRSEAGLPVLKYSFSLAVNDFINENITKKNVSNEDLLLKKLKNTEMQMAFYKEALDKQKIQENEKNLSAEEAIIIKQAKLKADSILNLANIKAKWILEQSKKDTANREVKLERAVADISGSDFEDMSVKAEEFETLAKVKSYKKQIEELSSRQQKSAEDSIDIKASKLNLRREFVDLARNQLELDRLKAKTHEDSLKIEQREAELFLIEQNMDLAAKEIETAKQQLKMKDLELQKKNLILYGVIFVFILLLGLLAVIYIHYRDKKRMNEILEKQNNDLEKHNKRIQEQNRQIMASINYGKRIQDAILPSNKLLSHFFTDSFVFFRPRDVVSGDFYWFSMQGDKLFVAAVDCTGHGVPGAFMSLIGNSLLNQIVNEKGIYTPSEILDELNDGVNKALSQSKSGNDDHVDGMDITLCQFDKANKEIQLACANHTAYIINGSEVKEIEGDEFSIADESKLESQKFTNHKIPMDRNAMLYMFSDGFPDQFGGPKGKKFYSSKLKKLFLEHQKLDAAAQYAVLDKTFTEWKGTTKQYDDVLVMGFNLNFDRK